LDGIAASSGVAIGPSLIILGRRGKVARSRISKDQIEQEIDRFDQARAATRGHLAAMRDKVAATLGRELSGIIDSHLLVLDDPTVVAQTQDRVRERLEVVEYAYAKVTQQIVREFEGFEDEFFRERSNDVLDVRERVLQQLLGLTPPDLETLDEPVIVVAERFTPCATLELARDKVLGFVTARGGKGAHAALLARSMEIPAVVGVAGLMEAVDAGVTLAIDGHSGTVIVDPDPSEIEEFRERRRRFCAFVTGLESLRDEEALTKDDRVVPLLANIEYPNEVDSVISHGARGIGLYRTEFLLAKPGIEAAFDEEIQYRAYHSVASALFPHPVVIRTFDLGGDKRFVASWEAEDNPFLGYRAIRLCLGHEKLFRTQLRALLRAAEVGNLQILLPMISGLCEVQEAKRVLESVKDELHAEGTPFRADVPLGAMIEIPSAALCTDLLAREVDFFSIGTNDLTQYTLAVDRNNERVDYLYEPLHPALLRQFRMVIDMAHAANRPVGICGELAGDPLATMVLLGMGFDSLSTNLMVLPEIKKVIRSISMTDARAITKEVLSMSCARDVRAHLAEVAEEFFPWVEI
jgi:phosphotransferase system enzyme I (PtsI)